MSSRDIDKIGLPLFCINSEIEKCWELELSFFNIGNVLPSIVWDIEIIGNSIIDTQDIIKFLENENIKLGMIKYKIDKDYIEELILNQLRFFLCKHRNKGN